MKQVKRRSYAALLLALALLAGLGLFVFRFVTQGSRWVSFSANQNLYRGGRLLSGTVTDRGGLTLASVRDGERKYAEEALLRTACLHAVGDPEGNIGTGALTAFADSLGGYSLLSGTDAAGGTLALSIDAQLCATAYEALAGGGHRGAVLLADYTTGEILCMTSSPSYDPETGFDAGDGWYDGVWLNRALSVAYTPGSVFKLVTMAAALENLPDLDARTFTCNGSMTADGSVITCTGIHGQQTVEEALANSCNVAFAELSLELGGETLRRYAERFGLTGQLTLSGIYTAAGRFEAGAAGSPALAWSGIGQSTDLVCPAALLRYVCAIASGGTAVGPVLRRGEHGAEERLLPEETAQRLREMLRYNVTRAYGAGSFPGLPLGAKTGTAEVGDGTSHAWFTGFLDDPAHPYAFVVVVEHGGGGLRVAGPIANAVLQKAVSMQG